MEKDMMYLNGLMAFFLAFTQYSLGLNRISASLYRSPVRLLVKPSGNSKVLLGLKAKTLLENMMITMHVLITTTLITTTTNNNY